MRFSKVMGLTTPQNGLEFFDLNTVDDTELFIDSYYFTQGNINRHVSKVHKTLRIFMHDFLNLVRNNKISEAYELCSHFQETKGTGLGYAYHKIQGNGAGKVLSRQLVDVIFRSKAITSQAVTHLEEFMITCSGIGKDRVSDIVLSVGKLGFIEFTQEQCRKHSIPMKTTNEKLTYFCPVAKTWKSDYFELPHIPASNSSEGQYIILIPKNLLSEKVVYTAEYFIRHVIKPHFKEDAIKRGLACVRTRKNGDKYVIIEDLLKHPEYHANGKIDINKFIEKHPKSLELFRRLHAPNRYEQLNGILNVA